jgi:hypothetical protein
VNLQATFGRYFRIALPFVLAACVCGQTTSTEILGQVTDPTGSVVPGARITITRTATGEQRAALANQAGEYTFPLIEIGQYNVRCEMAGFKTKTVTGLRVEIQQKARVDFVLEVGEVTESVEVSASAVPLKTDDATVGQVIENRRIIELPLNGRNLSQLAVLVAGVQYGRRTGMADGQSGFPIPGASVSVIANGKREITQTVSLDGVDAKEPRTHITVFTPSIEAIEEFKVQTSSYSAEYGQGGGARIQISMKSGTNDLHGTAFEFLRNDKLDAENYFLNFEQAAGAPRLPKDRLRRNQFGAVASGPVLLPFYNGRNRTFWAFDYEGRRETQERVLVAFFPPDAFRRGDFSLLLTPPLNAAGRPVRNPIVIFDPQTGEPFPNNVIPATSLHPGAQNVIQQFLPRAQFQQTDPLDFTARGALPQVITQNQYFWRVDHQIGSNDRAFVRFAGDRSNRDTENINPNFPLFLYSHGTNVASQWLHTFSPSTINEARFGLNFALSDFFHPRSGTDFDPDSLGIGQYRVTTDGNRKFTSAETGVPLLGFTLGDVDTGSGLEDLKSYQFADNVSLSRGKHTFKAGGEYQYIVLDRRGANNPRGMLAFRATESGYDFASFVLGYPNQSQTGTGRTVTIPSVHRLGGYVLDDWKATSRLTVNLGVRWDYFGVPVDRGGFWRIVDFERMYSPPGGGAPIPTLYPPQLGDAGAVRLWDPQFKFFQPRVGFAYRPTNHWVVRFGGGWFANVEHMNNFAILQLAPPKAGSLEFNAVTDPAGSASVSYAGQNYNLSTRRFRPGSPVLTLDNPFVGGATVRPQNLLHIQPDHKSSDHWQWSFDIQRELPMNTAITVGYVGSKTTHVPNSIGNFNAAPPSTDTNFQRRRPYQRFYDPLTSNDVQDLGGIRYLDSFANGFYHGLQATVEKRYSKGLTFGLAYTFSKAHGDGPAGGNEEALYQDPNDRRGSRGRYFFDQTQNLVAHFVYELPFGAHLGGLAAGILKGWQVNGIVTLRSGFPFTVSGGDLNTGHGNIRPDRVADGSLGDAATRRRWFDTGAFRRVSCNVPGRPDLCHFGSAGINFLDSPGQRNLDFSTHKNFALTEKIKLQFRAELFNATNTPYFSEPNGVTFNALDSVTPDGPRDGEIRTLRAPMRIIQFGLKVLF